MARRKRVPTVGAKQLHPVQVSPQIRQLEAHRTKEAARRAEAPVIAADRGAFGTANQQYQDEAQSDRGATGAVESTLAQALAGLKGSGLSGKYLQQAKQSFTNEAASTASSLPYLLAGAGEEKAKALAAARTQLTSDKATAESSAASAMNQRLKEIRGAGSTALKEEGEHSTSAAKESKEASDEVKLAVNEGKRLIAAYPTEIPSDKEEWAQFTGQIAKADGIGLRAALAATKLLQQQIALHHARQQVSPFG